MLTSYQCKRFVYTVNVILSGDLLRLSRFEIVSVGIACCPYYSGGSARSTRRDQTLIHVLRIYLEAPYLPRSESDSACAFNAPRNVILIHQLDTRSNLCILSVE